jgi:excisionase family DNA binding protein
LCFWCLRASLAQVRRHEAQELNQGDSRLLSTGEAARLLGVSRQHVVDLCDSGRLPVSFVGTHRRIRRDAVELLIAGSDRATRDQVRSLLMAHALAGRIVTDPDRALELARRNLHAARARSARGSTAVWIDEWERLLDKPLSDVVTALTSSSPRSRELRQNNPFAGLLADEEREAVLETIRRQTKSRHASESMTTGSS